MERSNVNSTLKYDTSQYSGDGLYLNEDEAGTKEIIIIDNGGMLNLIYNPTDKHIAILDAETCAKPDPEFLPSTLNIAETGGVDNDTLLKAIAVAQDPSLIKDLL